MPILSAFFLYEDAQNDPATRPQAKKHRRHTLWGTLRMLLSRERSCRSFSASCYSGLIQRVSPSTRSTRARCPFVSTVCPAFFAFHVVPRNSTLPTAPAGSSSITTAVSPTIESTSCPTGSRAFIQARSELRKRNSEIRDRIENSSHCSHAVLSHSSPASAPTISAASPKDRKSTRLNSSHLV